MECSSTEEAACIPLGTVHRMGDSLYGTAALLASSMGLAVAVAVVPSIHFYLSHYGHFGADVARPEEERHA